MISYKGGIAPKLIAVLMVAVIGITACGQHNSTKDQNPNKESLATNEQTTKTIKTARGDVSFEKMPSKLAVYDWASLDTLNELGVPVGATTGSMRVEYLEPAFDKAVQVGTVFEVDYEALHAYQPQLIITGGPNASHFDDLSKVAPTIDMTVDNENIIATGKERILAFGAFFDKQTTAQNLVAQIDERIAKANQLAQMHIKNNNGKALVLSVTGAKMAAFGAKSRLSGWIYDDVGLLAVDEKLSNEPHGQPISHEYIAKVNPDWIFVLDRTAALGESGKSAVQVLDNRLVQQTTAWKKSQVVVLPTANYVVAGGARQMLLAGEQLIDAFEKADKIDETKKSKP